MGGGVGGGESVCSISALSEVLFRFKTISRQAMRTWRQMEGEKSSKLIMHVLGGTHTGNSAIQEKNAAHLSKVMEREAIKIMHYYIYIYINVCLHTEPNAHYYIYI